ncbi:hypothetical protein D9M72_387000 [compost metagenome]
MHAVELDAQVGDAGARAFARFQVDQELAAVLGDIAQLVQVGVVAARDHAAVAHHGRGFFGDRAHQQVQGRLRYGQVLQRLRQQRAVLLVADAGPHVGQRAQRIAQRGQVARARAQQRQARGDALDIGQPAQRGAQRIGALVDQRADGLLPGLRHGRVAQRMVQPVAQRAAAHRGAAGIQQREQRRRLAAAQRLGQFQVAARGRIQAKVFRLALDLQALHVAQRLALRSGGVVQQRAGRAQRGTQPGTAERVQAGHAQLLAQPARAGVLVEMPFGQAGTRARQRGQFNAIGI